MPALDWGKLTWRKSSRSGWDGNCVEVGLTESLVGIRDSKNPGPVLEFSPVSFRAFLDGVKEGQFDRT